MENNIIDHIKVIQDMIQENTDKKWMTIRDVIEYTRLSDSTIRRAIQMGQLKVSKSVGKLLFRRSWVNKFLGE